MRRYPGENGIPIDAAAVADMQFVFGSNKAGIHGAGAARDAKMQYGAKEGVGEGPTGKAYALPTKNRQIQNVSLEEIKEAVDRFLDHARSHPHDTFQVTQVGTGLASWTKADIAPLFANAPRNCYFDSDWADVLPSHFKFWGTFPGNPNR